MLEFLLASENMPFSVALAVMFGIALLEGALTLLGAGLSNLVETIIPGSPAVDVDFDIDFDVDVDVDVDIGESGDGFETSGGGLSKILGWLYIGRVPALVLLVVLLTIFGLTGYILQATVHGFSGWLLPGWIAWIPALAVSLPLVRWSAKGISKIIPRDETSAVSSDTFIGRVATIVIGTAKDGKPAQGRLKDQHGQSHYIMVEPDLPNTQFPSGSHVLLVSRNGHLFKGIEPPNDALIDEQA